MNKSKNLPQLLLLSALVCLAIPQAQAQFFDRLKAKAKEATSVVRETISDINEDRSNDDNENKVESESEPEVRPLESIVAANNSATQSSGNIDIVGLKLGMLPGEVRAVLSDTNEGFNVEEVKGSYVVGVDYIDRIEASEGTKLGVGFSEGERITIEFAEPPSSNVVNQISRELFFIDGEGPSIKNVTNSLVSKMGRDPHEDSRENSLIWFFQDNVELGAFKCISTGVPESYKNKRESNYAAVNWRRCGFFTATNMLTGNDGQSVRKLTSILLSTTTIDEQVVATEEYIKNNKDSENQRLRDAADTREIPKF